jgi:glutathione S-transferase
MLVLYNAPRSTCSQKVRMALHEKGLSWDDRLVDLLNFEQLTPEYLSINPHGVIPTLLYDGAPVIDSSVIIEFLDQVFPDPALAPADPLQVARMRAWMRYFEEVPTQAIRVPTFNSLLMERLRSMSEEDFEAVTAAMPLRRQFYRRLDRGGGGFDKRETEEARQRLRSSLEKVNESLRHNHWICGEQFTLADITLMPTVVRMEDLGMSSMWDDLDGVASWYGRLQSRPCFDLTYFEGSRVSNA